MENTQINILIFDSDDMTATLIENYLKEFDFSYNIKKYDKFNKDLITCDNSLYNFIFVDVSKDSDAILDGIHDIQKNKKNVFFLLCEEPTTDLYVKSLRAGAKEFLKKPIERNFFISAIKDNYTDKNEDIKPKRDAKIITVVSNEVSCGKTTFAINLSREISEIKKEKVLLIDFNDNMCNVDFLLDINSINDTNYFLKYTTEKNAKSIFSKLYQHNNTSMFVMSVNMYKQVDRSISTTNIRNFIEIASEYFKYIIIDVNNSMETVNSDIFALSNINFYIISASINTNLKNKIFIENKLKNNKYNIILNKYRSKDDVKLKEIENILGISLEYKIPLNFGISSFYNDIGKTIRDIKPESEILKEYDRIAKYVITKA